MRWRDHIPVHPAAEQMGKMPEDELRALGEDIRQHGLRFPIVLLDTDGTLQVLDGCRRLDAMQLVGLPVVDDSGRLVVSSETITVAPDFDAEAYVVSINLRRRHLPFAERVEIAKKPRSKNPELTDREIARRAGVSHQSVGKHGQGNGPRDHNAAQPAKKAGERRETSGRKARGNKPSSGNKRKLEAPPTAMPAPTPAAASPTVPELVPEPLLEPELPLVLPDTKDPIIHWAGRAWEIISGARADLPCDDLRRLIADLRRQLDDLEHDLPQLPAVKNGRAFVVERQKTQGDFAENRKLVRS